MHDDSCGSWVLVGNVSPEHSLNINSNLIQAMFIVCSGYVRCHTSFILHSCSVRIFKKNSGSVQTLVTLSSALFSSFRFCSNCCHTLFCLQKDKRGQGQPLQNLFRFCSDWRLPLSFKDSQFTFRSVFVHIHTLFILCSNSIFVRQYG